jgi:hypothetical protein
VKKQHLTLLFVLFAANAFGGENKTALKDSSAAEVARNFLKEGHFGLHLRSIGMYTKNYKELLNFGAVTTGAGIHYASAEDRMFQIGASGFFIFRVHQHNLERVDPISGGGSRYEITLLDMHDPENGTDLDRLEDLYIRFKHKNLKVVVGRQEIETPLLNRQDNRMRPNIFQGIVAEYQHKGYQFTGAFIQGVTPRGTVDWYTIENSMGVYPFGRDVEGNTSQFPGNISTKGILLIGAQKKHKNINYQFWNYYTENIFNLSFAQADYYNKEWKLGLQGFYQTAINNGGNSDRTKAFIMPNEQTFGIGGKLGHRIKDNLLSLNYLHISDNGRFLFPREWGREQFYANLNRERFEGNGGLNAITLKYKINHFVSSNGDLSLGASMVNNGGLDNFRLNKYGMPEYYHLAAVYDYNFTGVLEGLFIRALVASKIASETVPLSQLSNRANLVNLTLLIDYKF